MSETAVAEEQVTTPVAESTGTAVAHRRLLTKKQILAAKDIMFEEVPVPEWAAEGMLPEENLRPHQDAERQGTRCL
jgi:hypothetical protein